MNENIDLTQILKDCPKGTKFYSTLFGEVIVNVLSSDIGYSNPIILFKSENDTIPLCALSKTGKYNSRFNGECTLFPSKDQRDWSKFTAPWYKKEKFDPKTLKPFDKVLVRLLNFKWRVNFFSNKEDGAYTCIEHTFKYCIPYNDDTKHLLGTTDEAPKFYKYWED